MSSKNSWIHDVKTSTPAAFGEGLPPAPPTEVLQAGGGSRGHDQLPHSDGGKGHGLWCGEFLNTLGNREDPKFTTAKGRG